MKAPSKSAAGLECISLRCSCEVLGPYTSAVDTRSSERYTQTSGAAAEPVSTRAVSAAVVAGDAAELDAQV